MRPKILFLLVLLLSFLSLNILQAQCPRGKVNCEGECGRFIDENGDGYCDLPLAGVKKASKHSSIQEESKKLDNKKLESRKIDPKKQVQDTSTEDTIVDSLSAEPIVVGEDTIVEAVVVAIANREELNPRHSREIQDEEEAIETSEQLKKPKPYRLISITSMTLLAYFLTMMLVRSGRMKRLTHRKIWNTILLTTFLMSCLLGLLLVIQINYHVLQSLYLLNLKLHVEFGIAMTLVAVIHIFWHLTYFKKLIRKKPSPTTEPNE